MKNVKSETALKFGVGIYRNNSEKKVYECGGKKTACINNRESSILN